MGILTTIKIIMKIAKTRKSSFCKNLPTYEIQTWLNSLKIVSFKIYLKCKKYLVLSNSYKISKRLRKNFTFEI